MILDRPFIYFFKFDTNNAEDSIEIEKFTYSLIVYFHASQTHTRLYGFKYDVCKIDVVKFITYCFPLTIKKKKEKKKVNNLVFLFCNKSD